MLPFSLVFGSMVGTSAQHAVVEDRIDPARAAALYATLGLDKQPPVSGDPLPPFFHHIYFWDPADAASLGVDGHRATHEESSQRMWAGGRLTLHRDFRAGVAAKKTTSLKSEEEKTGKSGPLKFVTLSHVVQQRGEAVLTEEQSLVYRRHVLPDSPQTTRHTRNAEISEPLSFTEVDLFRYSALTFNAHRIHYDIEYCRDVGGYPGLVVHGPLLALKLALLASRRLGPLVGFSYRAHSPLFLGESANLCANGHDLWVEGPEGRICMTAAAKTAL